MRTQRIARPLVAPVTQLRVADPVVTPGSTLYGEVVVATGAAAARLDTLALALITEMSAPNGALPRVLAKEPLAPYVTVEPYQTRTLPFSFAIPPYTPLSLGAQRVVIRAALELSAAEPGASDVLIVRPHPLMERVFAGLEELGFWIGGVTYDLLRQPAHGFPYTQRFTFRPPGRFRSSVTSLTLWFALREDLLEAVLELAPTEGRERRCISRIARLALSAGDQWEHVTSRLERLITRRIVARPAGINRGQAREVGVWHPG